jgi:hypothetical protein
VELSNLKPALPELEAPGHNNTSIHCNPANLAQNEPKSTLFVLRLTKKGEAKHQEGIDKNAPVSGEIIHGQEVSTLLARQ